MQVPGGLGLVVLTGGTLVQVQGRRVGGFELVVVTVVLVQVPGRRVGGSDLVGLWCRCRVDGLVVLTGGSDGGFGAGAG